MSSPAEAEPSSTPVQAWKRAWFPPSATSAPVATVPLLPSDHTLNWETYLTRLSNRLAWLIDQEADPEQAAQIVDRAFLDRLGRTFPWDNPNRPLAPQIALSEETEMLLAQVHEVRMKDFPQAVTQSADDSRRAMSALRETSLEDWVSLLLPSNG